MVVLKTIIFFEKMNNLAKYLKEQFVYERYNYVYDDMETAIPIREALRFIAENKWCTCMNCSLHPHTLCHNSLFAWKHFLLKLLRLVDKYKREREEMKDEGEVLD